MRVKMDRPTCRLTRIAVLLCSVIVVVGVSTIAMGIDRSERAEVESCLQTAQAMCFSHRVPWGGPCRSATARNCLAALRKARDAAQPDVHQHRESEHEGVDPARVRSSVRDNPALCF